MAEDKGKDKKEEKTEEGEEQPADAVAPKKSKKMLFIIGGLVVLLLAIGAPVTFFMLKKAGPIDEQVSADIASTGGLVVEGAQDGEDELEEGEEALGAIFPLETFVVNLSGGKFLRCQLQIEFKTRDVPKRFYSKIVPVRDAVIALMTLRTENDLSSADGKETFKSDVKDLVNGILRREEVKKIYITQFVIQ